MIPPHAEVLDKFRTPVDQCSPKEGPNNAFEPYIPALSNACRFQTLIYKRRHVCI